MDGLPPSLLRSGMAFWADRPEPAVRQRTLKAPIGCVGVGLHGGRKVSLGLHPAPAGSGIVFQRTDLGVEIEARYDRVIDTRLCTVLGDEGHPEARVGTVEHLMAALAGCGVTNARVTVDAPELPILDGSAANFVFLIDCAGTVAQDETVSTVAVTRPVRVADGQAFAELWPSDADGLDLDMSIDFAARAIGRQAMTVALTPDNFRSELAFARTFTLAQDVERLRAAGLGLGGSLDNALVVDDERVLNPGGLRSPEEFVRHKLLDAVGDLSLAGVALRGRFVSHRGGHALNNRLLRALFADEANWVPVATAPHDAMDYAAWRDDRVAVIASAA